MANETRSIPAPPRPPNALHRRFPTYADLRARACRRMPKFAFDFVDTGAGSDACMLRNAGAFDAIELMPRFGDPVHTAATSVELFGRTYSQPLGIAPMSLASLGWPRAEEYMARAAQSAGIPYVLATGAALSIERAAALAPDSFWFQLYPVPRNDHAVSFDLIRRAADAGAQALVVTIDNPARPIRLRDLRNNLVPPFRVGPRMMLQAACAPAWVTALLRSGTPRFDNLVPYIDSKNPSAWNTAEFAVREVVDNFTWADIARIREKWKRPLIVKGILHPKDAEKAIAAGADGVWVSNHGGRTFDAAPATIDVLPAIVAAVGARTTVVLDSGVRSGLDVVRARALGAKAVFAGRAFLFAAAALGPGGAAHMIELFSRDVSNALAFLGAAGIDGVTDDALWRTQTPSR